MENLTIRQLIGDYSDERNIREYIRYKVIRCDICHEHGKGKEYS